MNIPSPATKDELKEYAAELRRLRRKEQIKPAGRRDDALIEECSQSINYCEQRLAELGAEKTAALSGFRSRAKWIAAAAAALAVLFAASAVSYAYGRKTLSDDVQWNVRHYYFEDDGKLYTYEEIMRASVDIPRDELEHRIFDSEEALRAEFGEGLLLPGSLRAVYFVSAETWGVRGNALIRCEYRVNKKKLILEIDSFDSESKDVHGETQLQYDPHAFDTYQSSSLFLGESPQSSFAYFYHGNEQYIMTGAQGADIIEDIAIKLIASGRNN